MRATPLLALSSDPQAQRLPGTQSLPAGRQQTFSPHRPTWPGPASVLPHSLGQVCPPPWSKHSPRQMGQLVMGPLPYWAGISCSLSGSFMLLGGGADQMPPQRGLPPSSADKAAFPWPVCPRPALASNCPVPCPHHRGAHRQVWGWPFLGRTYVQLSPAQSRPHSREFLQQYHSPDLTPKLNQNPWAGARSACL